VADVTHLLAELIENATHYSPPNTRVNVIGNTVASGFVVEIEDRGLGIPPATLAVLNERLANPPEFDLADADQLGLFVVSRLAARNEIRVSLRGSPFGGTTAIVLIPHRIVVEDEASALPAAALVPSAISPPGWERGGSGTAPEPADMQVQLTGYADLPRRARQASLAPQLRDDPQADAAAGRGRHNARSADQARALISAVRQGWQNGRAGADQANGAAQGPPRDADPNSNYGRAES
jgi:hypothetical protein